MTNENPQPHKRQPRQLPDGFVSVIEAGRQVGVGPGASLTAAKRGDIPFFQFGQVWIVRADWLERKTQQAETAAAERQRRFIEDRERRKEQQAAGTGPGQR